MSQGNCTDGWWSYSCFLPTNLNCQSSGLSKARVHYTWGLGVASLSPSAPLWKGVLSLWFQCPDTSRSFMSYFVLNISALCEEDATVWFIYYFILWSFRLTKRLKNCTVNTSISIVVLTFGKDPFLLASQNPSVLLILHEPYPCEPSLLLPSASHERPPQWGFCRDRFPLWCRRILCCLMLGTQACAAAGGFRLWGGGLGRCKCWNHNGVSTLEISGVVSLFLWALLPPLKASLSSGMWWNRGAVQAVEHHHSRNFLLALLFRSGLARPIMSKAGLSHYPRARCPPPCLSCQALGSLGLAFSSAWVEDLFVDSHIRLPCSQRSLSARHCTDTPEQGRYGSNLLKSPGLEGEVSAVQCGESSEVSSKNGCHSGLQ